MGEILPAKIRGSAASVATAFNWTCTFIVTKTFIDMIGKHDKLFILFYCNQKLNILILNLAVIGNHGAFWFFGSICVIGLFFSIFYVPETQGKKK